MKKITKIEVSFMNDFVPFLRSFNGGGRDVARIFIRESEKSLHEDDKPNAASRICERLQNVLTPERWVSGSFIWEYSADGASFWEDIDLKWRQFISIGTLGISEFVGEVVLDDIQSLISESIQGKYYTVKDLSYNRPVEKVFESGTWNNYIGSELTKTGGKYLVLSDFPEDKNMKWLGEVLRPVIKVWIPELNSAWWVFYYPLNISAE